MKLTRTFRPGPASKSVASEHRASTIHVLSDGLATCSVCRKEELQEQLWEISVNIVKHHLSPEVLGQYGAAFTAGSTGQQRDEATDQSANQQEECSEEPSGQQSLPGQPTDTHSVEASA